MPQPYLPPPAELEFEESRARPLFWPRLARAAMLLVVGAAVHQWLLPSRIPTGARDAVPGTAAQGDRLVSTAGASGSLVPAASAVSSTPVAGVVASSASNLAARGADSMESGAEHPGVAGTTGAAEPERRSRPRVSPAPGASGPAARGGKAERALPVSRPSARTGGPSALPAVGLPLSGKGPAAVPEVRGFEFTVRPAVEPGSEIAQPARARSLLEEETRASSAGPSIRGARRVGADAIGAGSRMGADAERDATARVREVLQEYRAAYESLDVAAARSIWPSVDHVALAHAFRQLSRQRLTFESCGISVSGASALARCQGSAEYVPKVGGAHALLATGEWVFDLAKNEADWKIVSASVR